MAKATRHGERAIVAIPKNYDPKKVVETGKIDFTDEDIREIVELGEALRRMRIRLIAQGRWQDKKHGK